MYKCYNLAHMDIKKTLKNYLHYHPDEKKDLERLTNQLKNPEDILSRKNFEGHVTASAFILDKNSNQVLLLEHKSLGKLLQPGGHVEPEDKSLIEATLREIEEETGLRRSDLLLHSADLNDPTLPIDIDTHHIPENPKKGEPAHYHHDFRFLYTTSNYNVSFDPSESNTYQWVDWEDFRDNTTFQHIADKITSVMEPDVRGFFRSLVSDNDKKISVIAVSHIIPSSEDYINSLDENFNLIGIIPKPKSVNENSLTRLKASGISILEQYTRESIDDDPASLVNLLKKHQNICLVDIGGYFSNVYPQLKESLGDRLIGIIEDTENGLQRYENNKNHDCIVMSVARSELKNFEDQLVGHGIAHATETVLRQINILINYKNCGIIGYGKIGKGIAEYLQQRNIRPRVCEINPIRSVQAACDGAIICNIDALIAESDVILCATGSRALDIVKLRDLRKGSYVASATSSEDEFDLRFVDEEYKQERIDAHIIRYSKRGHSFHLLNNGNAINFLFSAAVDKYINLVQGELIYSISKITKVQNSGVILVNDTKEHEDIAREWLNFVLKKVTIA